MDFKDYIQIIIAIIMSGTLIAAIIQLRLLANQIKIQQVSSQEHSILLEKQVHLLGEQLNFQYEWNKKERALDYSLNRNKILQQSRVQLESLFGNIHQRPHEIESDEIKKILDDNKYSYTVITSLLAHWENMALAIQKGIVDEDVAYEMTAGLVIDYVRAFKEFIKTRRDENNRRAYAYLLPLASRWEARLHGDTLPESMR